MNSTIHILAQEVMSLIKGPQRLSDTRLLSFLCQRVVMRHDPSLKVGITIRIFYSNTFK